jgi:antitoxin PrlF
MSTSVITRKGQVTIPAEIRRDLGLKEGDRVEFVRDHDQIRIRPIGDVVKETAGVFYKYRRFPVPTVEELDEFVQQAIAEDVIERMNN